MPSAAPDGRLLDPVEDALGRADLVGDRTTRARTRGARSPRRRGARRGTPRRARDGSAGAPSTTRQSRNVACLTSWSSCPPRSVCGFHTSISDSVWPMSIAVLRPRCWSGKNSTLVAPRRAPTRGSPGRWRTCRRHRRARRRTPSSAAEEFMYVIGTTRSTSVTWASSSQASSTWSMFAMSAMEQPAFRSGQDHPLMVAREDVGGLGHEVDAAEDDVRGLGVVRREAGELEGVTAACRPSR